MLRSAAIAQAKQDVRYYLNGIHFHNDRVESTNGHVCYMAVCNDDNPEWYDQWYDESWTEKDIIISIAGKIPASKKISYALIENDGDDRFLIRYLNKHGIQIDVGMGDKIEGKFPDIPKLIAGIRQQEKSSNAVGFNTGYLAMADKMFNRKRRFPIIKLELFGAQSAAVFTLVDKTSHGVKEVFVVMPAQL